MVTWDGNRKLIAGLWPGYEPTAEEKALYAERLSHRRQDWLEEAIKRHRSEDANGAYKPMLSKIIAHYNDIAEAGQATAGPTRERRVLGYRACWQDRQGRVFASSQVFNDREIAAGFSGSMADSIGGSVRPPIMVGGGNA